MARGRSKSFYFTESGGAVIY